MYLSKLSARNLKGADLDLDLTRATAIVGENYAGKTRITDAARLLLVGYLPELGMKPAATFGLASGPFLEVSGVLTDDAGMDLFVRRRWELDGDSVRSTHDVPDALKKCGVLTVMLNAEEYFGLSDRDRVAYVFKNVGMPPLDLGALADRLRKAVAGYEPTFPGADSRPGEGTTPQEFVEHNLAAATEEGKKAKDWARRMEETVRGLTGLRAQDDVLGAPRAGLLDERARVERELTALNERKGLKIGAFTAMKEAAHRRETVSREIRHAEKDVLEVSNLRHKLDLIVGDLAKDPGAPGLEALEEEQAVVSAIVIRKAAAMQELARARDEYRGIETRLRDLDGERTCPYCGAEGDGWKALKAAELATQSHDVKERGVKLSDAVNAAAEEEAAARGRLELSRARFTTARNLTAEAAKIRGALATLEPRVARVGALNESLAHLPPHDEALAAEVEDVQMQINVRTQEAEALERVLNQQNARHGELARLAEAEAERDKAQAEEAKWKQAAEALRAEKEGLVEAAFRPMLAAANAFFPGVLRAPLDYRRGEVGMWVAGAWVGHATFSGTEKTLTYAVIQAALAARSPVRLMLLDEMGRLTARNAAEVASLLCRAVSDGRLDQCFVVDPERPELYRAAMAADADTFKETTFEIVTVHN